MDINVCLLGGGTRLAAHLGALRGIEEHGGRFRAWAGASAGSILASVLACGATQAEAMDLLLRTDFKQFLDFRPFGILRGYGLYAGRRLERWLEEVLGGRTFGEVTTPLAVVCTDIVSAQPRIFASWLTPKVKVSAAVRCSVGIPGIFAVRKMDEDVLVDGVLVNPDAASLFPPSGNVDITIRLARDLASAPSVSKRFGLFSYIQQVATLLLDAVDQTRLPFDHWQRTLLVRTGAHSSIDFELTIEEKQSLYQMGYDQAIKYFDLKALASATPPPFSADSTKSVDHGGFSP
ncbi:MAG: patatin-like phospholipase family protein [Planctomycetota bacterium]